MGGCASSPSKTSLSAPVAYEVLDQSGVDIQWGELTARLVNNRADGAVHREGYNGLAMLRHAGGPSPFVPLYAGINLEHVNNGRAYADRDLQFEPRRHPMELRKFGERMIELYQAPLPETGLESCTRFRFVEPHAIDVTFECVPHKEWC